MKKYSPYLAELRLLLRCKQEGSEFIQAVEAAVNGQASAKLEALVPRSSLKRAGAFFSNSALATTVASEFEPPNKKNHLAATDLACGAGNLLIAAARKLPVSESLTATLKHWGMRLAGFDLQSEFVEATHLRLALFARHLGAKFDLGAQDRLKNFFPFIRKADGIQGLSTLSTPGHLLLNPPFNQVSAPKVCSWGSGKISRAALFVDQCICQVPVGTKISAILPDVLRSGSRYKRWREKMEASAAITRIKPMGNFQTADVDVFIIDFTTGGNTPGLTKGVQWWQQGESSKNVGQQFDVHVGAVVKHRLKRNHPKRPYLHAKGLPYWGELAEFGDEVRFEGPLVQPPFVAIRRTSSPSDRHRAIATVISGTEPLAVDNHLIYCLPISGGKQSCEQLVKTLKTDRTNNFLNMRIRCRHLTVGVVREIPVVI